MMGVTHCAFEFEVFVNVLAEVLVESELILNGRILGNASANCILGSGSVCGH